MNISYSRASSYAGCPQKHFWAYVVGISPKKPVRPLQFGTDFHKLLEMRGSQKKLSIAKESIKDVFYDMPSQFQSELGDDYVEELFTVFEDYQKVWADTELPEKTEHRFEMPLGRYKGEPVNFVGVIDEIYEGGIKLGEHKTFSKAPDLNTLIMNQQINLYAKAYELENGVMPKYVQWDYIKSSPASQPVWLEKSQRFSAAASTSITPFSWERACKERGITDKQVLAKAQDYEQNIENFFFRHNLEINPNMAETIWADFKDLAREIVTKGSTNKRKNITKDCSWCSYQPLCYAEFTGADVDYIIKKDYEERGKKDVKKNGKS